MLHTHPKFPEVMHLLSNNIWYMISLTVTVHIVLCEIAITEANIWLISKSEGDSTAAMDLHIFGVQVS